MSGHLSSVTSSSRSPSSKLCSLGGRGDPGFARAVRLDSGRHRRRFPAWVPSSLRRGADLLFLVNPLLSLSSQSPSLSGAGQVGLIYKNKTKTELRVDSDLNVKESCHCGVPVPTHVRVSAPLGNPPLASRGDWLVRSYWPSRARSRPLLPAPRGVNGRGRRIGRRRA